MFSKEKKPAVALRMLFGITDTGEFRLQIGGDGGFAFDQVSGFLGVLCEIVEVIRFLEGFASRALPAA